jgi:hypothetical protein
MPIVWMCVCAIAGLLVALQTTQAVAQNARSFVSGQGSDSNPCTRAAPCRSFGTAIGATNAGGEVVVLDSAGYGPFTIGKAISIVNPGGVEASITAPALSNYGIDVQAGTNDTVALRGLTLEAAGGGVTAAGTGIAFHSGLRLEITDCVIHNFTEGIALYGEGESAISSVYISNTIVAGSSVYGILVDAFKPMIVRLSHVASRNNDIGVVISGSSLNNNEVMISDSHIDNNVTAGIRSDNGAIVLRNTTINQTPTGVDVVGYSIFWLSQVTEAAVGGFPNNGGVVFHNDGGTKHVYSDGTNRLAGVIGGSLEVWFVQ